MSKLCVVPIGETGTVTLAQKVHQSCKTSLLKCPMYVLVTK